MVLAIAAALLLSACGTSRRDVPRPRSEAWPAPAQIALDLQYYALREDVTTQLLIHRVLRAASRGVLVRLLIDDRYAVGRDLDLAALAANPNTQSRALIITGGGTKAFCVGADLKEMMAATADAQRERIRGVQETFDLLERLPIPSVAAINGYALGWGLELELALACTFRVAAPPN